ncbi:DUF3986 family protein [Candidatus Woesearchaeota archaeon]|nr:DUF3986 family protein [Candidatus Woesearchaeota archaeon]
MSYEDKHLHLGYYEDGHDLEGIALKVDGQDKWHVFFDFWRYCLPVPVSLRHAQKEAYAGVHVFTVTDTQVINKEVHNRFSAFVVKKVLPRLKKQLSVVQG